MKNKKKIVEDGVRLIDANALEYQYAHMIYPNGTEGLGYTAYVTSVQIKCEPTIDAVPVVRCKDCKHWNLIDEHIPHFECNIFCALHDRGYPTGADDFCSYGERKADGQ